MKTYKKILLDTNFLLIPYQFKVDIFSEIDRIIIAKYEIIVLDKTLQELENIVKNQKGKDKEAAKFALKLVENKKPAMIKTNNDKKTDDIILDYAIKEGCLVATQDKDLKRRLINQNIEVIVLRKKKFLAIANEKGFE